MTQKLTLLLFFFCFRQIHKDNRLLSAKSLELFRFTDKRNWNEKLMKTTLPRLPSKKIDPKHSKRSGHNWRGVVNKKPRLISVRIERKVVNKLVFKLFAFSASHCSIKSVFTKDGDYFDFGVKKTTGTVTLRALLLCKLQFKVTAKICTSRRENQEICR